MCQSRLSCFNGATAMEPWKSHALASFGRQHVVLQWGHGDGAVEELAKGARAKDKALLQWGHGDGAVEEPLTSGCARGSEPSFNGATAMEPWKRTSSPLQARAM